MKFYDRKYELDKLAKTETLAKDNFFFIRVTGRRRIGKTLLIREYLKQTGTQALYFFVTKKKIKPLLDEYASIIADQFPEYAGTGFKDIDDFFKFLFNLLKHRNVIIVFDEFQNFKYVEESAFSILQKFIDMTKQDIHGMLLVIGSINSMMRRIFEDHDKPLYGRLNSSFFLKHFSLLTVREILRDHGRTTDDDLLFFYSIFDGIPFYYSYLSDRAGYAKAPEVLFMEDILDENSILLDEGKEILLEEFGKDYSTYFSIMEAVAGGATTMSRIADVSGIPVNNLSRYITELIKDHELIERVVPFDAKSNNKMGRYYIKDNFIDFWFRYIFKNKSRIEMLSKDRMAREILDDLPVFKGKKFEKMVIAHLIELNREGKLVFHRIGQYWDRGETEIDVIYADDREKRLVFGECKLSKKRLSMEALKDKALSFLSSHRQYTNWSKTLHLYTPGEKDFLYKAFEIK